MLHCSKMAEKLEVFVLEPYEVDWFAFSLWLEGCSEEVATEKRREREERELENFRDFPDYDALLRSETKNDYRVFRALEVHLHNPPSLFAQVREGCKRHMAFATRPVAAGDVGGWRVVQCCSVVGHTEEVLRHHHTHTHWLLAPFPAEPVPPPRDLQGRAGPHVLLI